MHHTRTIVLAAALAAFTVATPADSARAADKDELARGEWEGKRTLRTTRTAGGSGGGDPATAPADPEEPGTPTPDDEPAPPEPDDGTEEDDGAIATEPDMPPEEGEPEPEPGDEPAGEPEGEPSDDGTVDWPQPATVLLPGCRAHWEFTEQLASPDLVEEHTLLTLLLWRQDAFGYVCNGYGRAESTWYIDWVATTRAQHEDENEYEVVLTLVQECPQCRPSIRLDGASFLETRAQIKTTWGSVSMDSAASASANATWQGELDAGDGCSVSARSGKGSSSYGAGFAGTKIENASGQQFVYAVGMGGRSDGKTLQAGRMRQKFTNRGDLMAYAAGSEDNVQAKVRAGQELEILASTACGATAEYTLEKIRR